MYASLLFGIQLCDQIWGLVWFSRGGSFLLWEPWQPFLWDGCPELSPGVRNALTPTNWELLVLPLIHHRHSACPGAGVSGWLPTAPWALSGEKNIISNFSFGLGASPLSLVSSQEEIVFYPLPCTQVLSPTQHPQSPGRMCFQFNF